MLVHHVNRVPIVIMVTPYQMSQELDFITSTMDCEPIHTHTPQTHTPQTHTHHTHTHTATLAFTLGCVTGAVVGAALMLAVRRR